MNNEGEIMTNVSFDYSFNGKVYQIKRATLRQVMEWQRKLLDMKKDASTPDAAILVPALYSILHNVDANITEDIILDNTPGDINVLQTLELLGFVSQQKMNNQTAKNVLANQPSGEKSSV